MSLADDLLAGRTPAVSAAVLPLTTAQRRALLPELKALRAQLREDWRLRSTAAPALMVAGAVCHSAPSQAAAWLRAAEFDGATEWHRPALRRLIDAQPEAWRAEVAARLAEHRRRTVGWGFSVPFQVTEYLVRTTGCPLPLTDALVLNWAEDRSFPQPRPDLPGRLPVGTGLHARLLADSFTPLLAPLMFEVVGTERVLEHSWSGQPESDRWPAALSRLAAEGVLDRAALVSRVLARLLRGGRPADLRPVLATLTALAPTAAELAAEVRTLLALLDGSSTVAGWAQQALTELDATGALEPEVLTEASRTVLFRPEKKLVKAQLAWLDRTAKQDPSRAAAVLLAASDAYGHPDRTLQEQALKLTARHLKAADDPTMAELRSTAQQLDPANHAAAAELLGLAAPAADGQEYREQLPPVPFPRAVPAPVAGPAEAAEELSAAIAGSPGVAEFERALDGLVRWAWLDAPGLAEALAPVLAAAPYVPLRFLAEAAAGLRAENWTTVPADGRHPAFHEPLHYPFPDQIASRLAEAARQLATERVPFLLATPTLETGALAPAVLVDRLARYEELGVTPGPADYGQALLRATPAGPEVRAAAARLNSPHGRRLAAWLRTGGLPHQPTTVGRTVPGTGAHRLLRFSHRSAVQPGLAPDALLPEVGPGTPVLPHCAAQLLGPTETVVRFDYQPPADVHAVAVLPNHREELASRFVLAALVNHDGIGDWGPLLPFLAEAEGPAGPALHLALAYGLGAKQPEDRTAAVDALLVLAARGDLDPTLLGRETVELILDGTTPPSRAARSLRAAAETGAYRTAWTVLAATLPALLTTDPPRGTADLLALAADCVRRCGPSGLDLPALAALAARPGTTKLLQEARALHALL
ncbi:DUF6493 family protein [Kitasatospora sp. NPDC051853]|uniref:DUF6493 family protein n=1 Tax=Kitasatospora sp. NPDC051853 TaxID=3364058 RepID=UPI0037A8D05A